MSIAKLKEPQPIRCAECGSDDLARINHGDSATYTCGQCGWTKTVSTLPRDKPSP